MENNFDKQYRNKVEQHNSSMDLEQFWSELEPKLPPQKKKRRFIFWLLIPLMLGAGIWFLKNHWNRNDSNPMASISTASTINQNINPDENMINEKSLETNNSKSTSETNSKVISSEFTECKISSDTRVDKAENNKNTIKASPKNVLNPYKGNKVSDPTANNLSPFIKTNATQTNTSSLENSKDENHSKDQTDLSSTKESNSIKEKSIGNENNTSNSKNEQSISSVLNYNEDKNHDPIKVANVKVIEEEQIILSKIDTLPNKTIQETLKEKNKINLRFYIRPEIMLGFYSKSLSTKENQYLNYIDLRNITESKLESWSSSINFGIQYKIINLETGLQYLQNNEKLEYYERQEKYIFGNTSITREFANGNRDTINDDAWYSEFSTRQVKHYNKIQQWNIPIQLGYDIVTKKKFTLGIQAGTLISISNKASGKTLSPQLTIDYLEKITINKVNTNLGLGIISGAYCRYHWSNRIDLTARFQYQNFTKSYLESLFYLRYQNFSFGIGIQFSL